MVARSVPFVVGRDGSTEAAPSRDDELRAAHLRTDPMLDIVRGRLRPGCTVLDVGCGAGTVAHLLAETGAAVDGIEPDVDLTAAASERVRHLHVGTLQTAVDDSELRDEYDVVLLIDVVEHFADPLEALALATDRLGPDGRILLFLPNSAHWTFRWKILRGDWRYQRWGLFDRTHLRFFDLRTANRLVRDAGLEVEARWHTAPDAGRLGRLGVRLRPTLFAFHVLLELRRP